MSKQSRITVKGQVTIPKDVRQLLGVRPGDRVTFEETNGMVTVRKSNPAPVDPEEQLRSFEERLARARKYAKPLTDMTADEYMALVREPVPLPGA